MLFAGALLLICQASANQTVIIPARLADVTRDTVTVTIPASEALAPLNEEDNYTALPIDIMITLSAEIDTTQLLSGSVGLVLGEDGAIIKGMTGVIVQLEPGITGGKVSLGWGSAVGTDFKKGFLEEGLIFIPAFGFAVKGFIFQGWGSETLQEARGISPGETYLGGEANLYFYFLQAHVGYSWQITGHETGSGILNFGIGTGF